MQSSEARMTIVVIHYPGGTEQVRGPFESTDAALAWSDAEPRDLVDGEPPEHEILPLFPTDDRLVTITRYDGEIPDAGDYVRDQAETLFSMSEHVADGLFTGYEGWTVTA